MVLVSNNDVQGINASLLSVSNELSANLKNTELELAKNQERIAKIQSNLSEFSGDSGSNIKEKFDKMLDESFDSMTASFGGDGKFISSISQEKGVIHAAVKNLPATRELDVFSGHLDSGYNSGQIYWYEAGSIWTHGLAIPQGCLFAVDVIIDSWTKSSHHYDPGACAYLRDSTNGLTYQYDWWSAWNHRSSGMTLMGFTDIGAIDTIVIKSYCGEADGRMASIDFTVRARYEGLFPM